MFTLFFVLCVIVATMVFIHRGFPGSVKDLGWKMSGTWANPNHDLHVMMYSNGQSMRGHVVWVNQDKDKLVGQLVIKGLDIKPFGKWSSGTFVEPVTQREQEIKLRLKNKSVLSVKLPDETTQEWKLVRSL